MVFLCGMCLDAFIYIFLLQVYFFFKVNNSHFYFVIFEWEVTIAEITLITVGCLLKKCFGRHFCLPLVMEDKVAYQHSRGSHLLIPL